MSEDQTQPKETTPEMSLHFKVTYEWIGTDYVVHLTDQYGYFDLRITFHFEYNNDGKLVRREYNGTVEVSAPLRAIATINSTTIARKYFFCWTELAVIIEALPGWLRGMIDMVRVRQDTSCVPESA